MKELYDHGIVGTNNISIKTNSAITLGWLY